MSTDARPSALVHASEELLEEYTFGRIREPQLGRLEEHLLICPQCQSELHDIEEYKVFMKAGLASFESERLAAARLRNLQTRLGSPVRPRSRVREASSPHLAWSRMPGARSLLTAAVLLVLAAAAVTWRMQSSPVARVPIATVRLVALRGGEGGVAHAPSGRPLHLVFNQRDLPTDVSYRAEVLNSSGLQMWSGNVRMADESFSLQLTGPLRAGTYWVRLYSSTGQLLREFALRVG
jgi:anti-sigma factor RsiW